MTANTASTAGPTTCGQIVTAGGRVLGVTALGGTLDEAIDNAYAAAKPISFTGMHFRTDIGRTTFF